MSLGLVSAAKNWQHDDTKYDGNGNILDCHVDYAYKHAGSPVVRPDYAYFNTPLRICAIHNIPDPLPPYIGDSTCPSVP